MPAPYSTKSLCLCLTCQVNVLCIVLFCILTAFNWSTISSFQSKYRLEPLCCRESSILFCFALLCTSCSSWCKRFCLCWPGTGTRITLQLLCYFQISSFVVVSCINMAEFHKVVFFFFTWMNNNNTVITRVDVLLLSSNYPSLCSLVLVWKDIEVIHQSLKGKDECLLIKFQIIFVFGSWTRWAGLETSENEPFSVCVEFRLATLTLGIVIDRLLFDAGTCAFWESQKVKRERHT